MNPPELQRAARAAAADVYSVHLVVGVHKWIETGDALLLARRWRALLTCAADRIERRFA